MGDDADWGSVLCAEHRLEALAARQPASTEQKLADLTLWSIVVPAAGWEPGMLRKQYHFRTIGAKLYAWDIHRLIRLSKPLTPLSVRVDDIPELDENWWYETSADVPTPRALAAHMALVQQADLAFPILLCADGRLMDGMHRLVKALLERREHIQAIRFPVTPEPDYMNRSADDLPYPDEEI